MKLPWHDIKTVLLDMDGTLLDLRFDSHFWLEHLPMRYGESHGLEPEDARARVHDEIEARRGTLEWYCLDHWARTLELDLVALKTEVQHLIAVHPHVPDFLHALRQAGKRVALVTNAHNDSLALKMERTGLAGYFDRVVCAHDLGLPKEDPAFWERLRETEPFEPARTLLVDDTLAVLRSAQRFGIEHLVAVTRPDSGAAVRPDSEFPGVVDFSELLPFVPAAV
jgi:putative hydrolase of the HAD superfamily